jgi:hypothetical protein
VIEFFDSLPDGLFELPKGADIHHLDVSPKLAAE